MDEPVSVAMAATASDSRPLRAGSDGQGAGALGQALSARDQQVVMGESGDRRRGQGAE